jgi:hypothetical protein
MKTEEEEEERRVLLEKRLKLNIDFDDALQVLDSTQILISNFGLVRFFMELVQILTRSLIRKFLSHWHRSLMKECHASHFTLKMKSN